MKEREEARTRDEKKKRRLAKEGNFKHRPGARIFFSFTFCTSNGRGVSNQIRSSNIRFSLLFIEGVDNLNPNQNTGF
jgi:hypothetical protein